MKNIKTIILYLLVFLLTITLAVYFEDNYRKFVRLFFRYFQKDIKFIGKDFHFVSLYFVVSFGLISIVFTFLSRGLSAKRRLFYFVLALLFFFMMTTMTTYIDSLGKVVECTICKDGVRSLQYNEVNYDFHFIASLVVGILPLFLTFLRKKISK